MKKTQVKQRIYFAHPECKQVELEESVCEFVTKESTLVSLLSVKVVNETSLMKWRIGTHEYDGNY